MINYNLSGARCYQHLKKTTRENRSFLFNFIQIQVQKLVLRYVVINILFYIKCMQFYLYIKFCQRQNATVFFYNYYCSVY